MKYFRNYPWGMQLLLFLLMTFTFLSVASFIVLSLFAKLSGYAYTEVTSINTASPYGLIQATRVMQGVQNMCIFMLPALVFAYLCHPRPGRYLGLRKPGKSIHYILAITLMLGAMPVLMFIQHLIQQLNFGASVRAEQLKLENLMQAMMKMPTVGSFIVTFIVIAIVPGIGEELFFRGVLMRFAKQRSRVFVIPALFSAIVFSYAHSNIYAFISIFLAGLLLAYIYYLTGSLWCSMLAHTLFNGTQIILHFAGNENAAVMAMMEQDSVPVGIVLGGAALFALSLWLLVKNKTPLPDNWADNFTQQELDDMQKDNKNKLF